MRTKKKCLIVDDDKIYLIYLKYFLEYNGFEVISSTSVDQAVVILATKKFELVITDIHMPWKSGFELLKEIKTIPHCENTPVLVVSDDNGYDLVKKALNLGANGFIQKPLLKEHMDQVYEIL